MKSLYPDSISVVVHAHTIYSDGGKDNSSTNPAAAYAFAKNSLCFDFLGISEHNHPAAGMSLADWQPGRNQAAASTTSAFVGLYGMEWGVISGGGHVIVYGMDSLIGWDAGQYQVYVPKSVYKGAGGLFDVLNRHGGNALAYLAHPNTTDYNDLLNGAYDLNADNYKEPEAIALYLKSGYSIIPNYGQYVNVENSVCMKKSTI